MLVLRTSGSSDFGTEGDSGGPVFLNSSAYGIIHACVHLITVDNCQGNDPGFVYTAVNYVENGLDGVVKTSP